MGFTSEGKGKGREKRKEKDKEKRMGFYIIDNPLGKGAAPLHL